jgi:hypothetical protein
MGLIIALTLAIFFVCYLVDKIIVLLIWIMDKVSLYLDARESKKRVWPPPTGSPITWF